MRILLALSWLVLPAFVLAHEVEEYAPEAVHFLERYDFLSIIYAASLLVAVLVFFIIIRPPLRGFSKGIFFLTLSVVVLTATFYLSAGTIYKNITSATGGPVHWHADFRIFNCGQEIVLKEPSGLSNRIGTPDVHEHGDLRIHVEGALKLLEEASLHGFIEAIGGRLTLQEMTIPTDEGNQVLRSGDLCSDGSEGKLQVFLWTTKNDTARQEKLLNFTEYVISPEPLVPPGDCIIFEFGQIKDETENICDQYRVAELRGDIEIIR